ncbi:antimicrobial resistance protein Mig-14 [Pseudomonas sp. RIT-PI-S]|uniref:antimicrobial resistance protein Mig-14 n=1 Tax=Pseudomonas sp. RIT-PI-S TaxID=3035295 RepID=UPI0021D7F2CB|nr:antimicrobial resistance protein Mig-14 [Pseudomonas sp. RIT-PI-S]
MLNALRCWRERGWTQISAQDYATLWSAFGGSVATHPSIVERLSGLADIPLRYLGYEQAGTLIAGIPCWGRDLALSKDVLKRLRKRGLFDLGNAEVIIPVAPDTRVPVRQRGRYVSALNEATVSTLRPQAETLAMARMPEDYSKKFRYNQRRELRLLEEAGGAVVPIASFTAGELAGIYADLFQRRWERPVPASDRLPEVFGLLREFMTGSVILLESAPVAIQVLYRVDSPAWVSVEYINGGVDPLSRAFSPGSVLSFINTQQEWDRARALGKTLRYSFGRGDREYKDRWCESVPVFEV